MNLRGRRDGEVLVALAGPASNLVMAVAGAIAWRILEAVGVIDLTTLERQRADVVARERSSTTSS